MRTPNTNEWPEQVTSAHSSNSMAPHNLTPHSKASGKPLTVPMIRGVYMGRCNRLSSAEITLEGSDWDG